MKYKMKLPENLKHDRVLFRKFYNKMFKEYMSHYEDKADSWMRLDKAYLYRLLMDSLRKHTFSELCDNPEHFIDIANLALFCHYNFEWDKEPVLDLRRKKKK